MSAPALDSLIQRLTSGDTEAAEQAFQAYEPVLRLMVRRWLTPRLRSKFDSMDVVQSVWADVLRNYRETGWHFADREHLKSFLAKVAYYHFANNCRSYSRALERECSYSNNEPLGLPPSNDPRPSQIAQADELWDRLIHHCPPAHHELLRLKREGLCLADIAARTGLHPSSVRRILYDLARRVSDADS
jgi:RNA polymerase sigma-70 factor (ECF subfamily)